MGFDFHYFITTIFSRLGFTADDAIGATPGPGIQSRTWRVSTPARHCAAAGKATAQRGALRWLSVTDNSRKAIAAGNMPPRPDT